MILLRNWVKYKLLSAPAFHFWHMGYWVLIYETSTKQNKVTGNKWYSLIVILQHSPQNFSHSTRTCIQEVTEGCLVTWLQAVIDSRSFCIACCQRLRWSRGSMLAFGTQVRGFKPGRSRQIFKGQIKIFSTPSFGGEVKPSVPCRRLAACKRSLNVTWKSTFRQNYQP